MKYSSHNLDDSALRCFPLRGKAPFMVVFSPGGKEVDSKMITASDPEPAVDALADARGWTKYPGYVPSDVWVDGVM